MRIWLLVVGLLVCALPAHADDRELAREEFAKGQAADARKDWQTAIEHYLRANDLKPHPFALFNIATDYERLGKLREAVTWYERYLKMSEDAADKQKVMKLLREISLRPGQVTVRSIPAGAVVLIDDRPAGKTPHTAMLGGGFHRVSVELDGQREHKDIRVEFAEPVNVEFALRGAVGVLSVVGGPYGAQVTVDDVPAGTLPAKLQLPPGEHKVRVTHDGFAPFEATATVTPNGEAEVRAQLVRALGTFDGKPTIQLGYMLGIAGGADVKGNGGLFLAEFGVRVGKYDGALRIGKSGSGTAIDFIVRMALTSRKLAPFIGVGYSSVVATGDDDGAGSSTTGSGYALVGGLRYDLSRTEKIGVSILGESGIRYYAGLTDSSGHDALVVPFMALLEIVYR